VVWSFWIRIPMGICIGLCTMVGVLPEIIYFLNYDLLLSKAVKMLFSFKKPLFIVLSLNTAIARLETYTGKTNM